METKRLIIYAAVIAGALCVIFLPGYSELNKLKEQGLQHQRRIRLLDEQNERLKAELEMMRKDPDYRERKAREKLGIVKKGEIIYKRNPEK